MKWCPLTVCAKAVWGMAVRGDSDQLQRDISDSSICVFESLNVFVLSGDVVNQEMYTSSSSAKLIQQ